MGLGNYTPRNREPGTLGIESHLNGDQPSIGESGF